MIKFFSFLAVLFFSCSAFAEDFAYSDKWLKMVHYQPKMFGGFEATVGSDSFYLSPYGRTNPEKELEATIALFQSNDDKTKCLFPARYELLKRNNIIDYEFPNCKDYEQFKQDLQPAGITFLFTDAYMNNSSSLFGHTLLRVDTKRKGTQLLAHGVNYGAFTNGYEGSFLYAIYGLIGAYPGGFTTKPYYDIINTYNNLENRDIWEYNLNLSQEELDLFVAHIWEVGQTLTPYYFFTQNCSYMLMEVLDAIRPDLNLAQDFKVQTIPLDTIKAVNLREGLVKSVNYRPSRQRKISHRISQMNKNQYAAFIKVVKENNSDLSSLSDEEKPDVLETAYQYVQYKYVAKELDLQEYRKKSFSILRLRNTAQSGQKFNELQDGANPTLSHDSAMILVGAGAQNGNIFEQFSIRPAYHSLTDNNKGYLKGAEINFLESVFRHYDNEDKYVLEKLNILELASFSPIDEVFQALSYKIDLNIKRLQNPKTLKEGYALKTNIASGGTYALNQNIYVYGLGSFDAAYGGFLPQNQWIGAGFGVGALAMYENFSFKTDVKKVYATTSIGSTLTFEAKINYFLNRNTAFEASFSHQNNKGKDVTENVFAVKRYF